MMGASGLTDDADLTFTGGNTLNATNATVATALTNSALTSTRVPIIGTAGLFGDDADLTFTGGNTLNATNATVTTALTNSALTSTRVPIIGTAGLFGDDADLTFTGGNTLQIGTGTNFATIGPVGGVATYNAITNSGTDYSTFNYAGINGPGVNGGTGTVTFSNSGSGNNTNIDALSGANINVGSASTTGSITIRNISGADMTLNTDDIIVTNALDVENTNTAVLTRNASTGEIEARTITTASTVYNDFGTYTPTLASGTNLDASTVRLFKYNQIGNVVTFSGAITLDPTAAGSVTFTLTLAPNGATFATIYDASGTIAGNAAVAGTTVGGLLANTGSTLLEVNVMTTLTTSHLIYITGMYTGAGVP
jgi:hypothetical protein